MRYFQSRSSNLLLISLLPFLVGVMVTWFPNIMWTKRFLSRANASDAVYLMIAGAIMAGFSFAWYWFERRYQEARGSQAVRLRMVQVFFRRLLILSASISSLTIVTLFLIFGPFQSTLGVATPVPFSALYSGLVAVICLTSLSVQLFRWWRGNVLRNNIFQWGRRLSYLPTEEVAFSFPAKIFNFGTDGGVDFSLEKDMAGIPVRIFQYSHMQDNNSESGPVYYSIISIITKDALPTFTFGRSSGVWKSILFASGNVDTKLNEEIDHASTIPFHLSNGDEFTLSVATQFEIEALQIFSDELVENLGTQWPEFLLIGGGRQLVAVLDQQILSEEVFKQYDALAHFLVDAIALRIDRIGKSVEAMQAVMER